MTTERDAMLAREEAAHLKTIDQRDAAEECVSDIYFKIIGRSPEWSNNFGFPEALEEIEDAVNALKAVARAVAPAPGVREALEELTMLRGFYETAKATDQYFVEIAQNEALQNVRQDYRFYMGWHQRNLDIAVQKIEERGRKK